MLPSLPRLVGTPWLGTLLHAAQAASRWRLADHFRRRKVTAAFAELERED